MYLENSEQSKVSGEGELSTQAILAEKCSVSRVTEVADLSSPSRGHAELGIKVLVDYAEQTVGGDMDPALLCEKHGNLNGDTENFEQYFASNGFFESDQTFDESETAGLSQPFDGCAQHCECFRPCKSSEHCANHSLASKCCACCEHCPEHLQLFQQCKPSDQQSESSDYEPDELEENCGSFEQLVRSDFTPGCTDLLHLQQQYEPMDQQCDSFDSEQETSTDDSEQSFTNNISDSGDLFDSAKTFDYYKNQTQIEAPNGDGEEDNESYEAEQNEMELSDEEFPRLSDDTPVQADFDDDDPYMRDFSETPLYEEENFQQVCETDLPIDASESYENYDNGYEPTQQSDSDNSADFNTEEDGSSECSSVESKSFKTCLDDSFASDPCSDSSGDSDRGPQEDSGDEQIQWESFEEEDEETQEINTNRNNEDEKKSPTADVVIENFFDFFDSAESYERAYAQKRQYISCFDGGDIHYRLHLEEEAQKLSAKIVHKLEDLNEGSDVQESDARSVEAPEEVDSSENQSEDWAVKSQSSSVGDEADEDESESFALYSEDSEEAGDDEGSDGHVSDACDQELEACLFAPCAKEISVEGDAYEDKVLASQNQELLDNNSSIVDETETSTDHEEGEDELKPELSVYLSCSEIEPYWALVDGEGTGEFRESEVEEYFAYQIKSIQTFWKQALNEFILVEGVAPGKKFKGALPSLSETEPEQHKSVTFGITDITELKSSGVEKSAESDEELDDISREIGPPLDIIHSVVLKHANEAPQNRDSEEEQSDDESYEHCECEYCIPPAEQV